MVRPACLEDSHRGVSCVPLPWVPANTARSHFKVPVGARQHCFPGNLLRSFPPLRLSPPATPWSTESRFLAKAFDSPRFRSDERTGGSSGWPTSDSQPSARLCWKLPSSSMLGGPWLAQLQGFCKPCCGAGMDAGIGTGLAAQAIGWLPRHRSVFSVPRILAASRSPTQHPRFISHTRRRGCVNIP